MNPTHSRFAIPVLNGQKIVIVGGDRREPALIRLRDAFAFEEVIHCCTRKVDASPRAFQSSLQLPDILLVVCARGLLRTHHGKQLHQMCRRLGIPFVDTFHFPHPNALLARIEDLRLWNALEARRAHILANRKRNLGGAA
jgi:hypothetical protein